MQKKSKEKFLDEFYEAVLCLEDADDCVKFFDSVCTPSETASIASRYKVAEMLRAGKTYTEIAEQTGASTVTISRVRRSLEIEGNGYDIVFNRIKEKKEA